MKKITLLILAVISVSAVTSCKKKTTETPVSELVKKVWIANKVTDNGTVVYTKGGTSTTVAYANYKLDLSLPPAATLTETDKSVFTGSYALSSDNKTITLSNLNPVPTGTGGTISYTISTYSSTQLNITRSGTNPKTGVANTQYELVTQ